MSITPQTPELEALGVSIRAGADELERTRRIPSSLLDELHQSGVLKLLLPRSVGGGEAAPADYLEIIEYLAKFDGSIAWNVFVANSAAIIAAFLEHPVALEIFGSGRSLLAWGPPNSHRAHAIEGGYRVSGEWHFASGCRQANWMGVHCQVVESSGQPRLDHRGQPAVRTLLFPAERAELIDNWDTLGLRGTASDGYRVADLEVAEAFSATREDPDGRVEQGPLYAIPMQGLYAVGVAGVALGMARAMLDECVQLATHKAPRGLGRLADSATVQGDIARVEAVLESARVWLKHILTDIYPSPLKMRI
ncbi:MAG: acyl-CoA dehydrogenase [Gammaproteobacteria bacterium]|nr:acyl-CoA dehydrogenase [Gammaproteobacteria bacterium]